MHDEFKTQALTRLQEEYPDAAILVHPESPQAIVEMADAVGSTSQLIAAAKTLQHQRLIVATDRGIFYKMQQAVPDKKLLEAPTAGEGATCRSCAHCPWMAMNGLQAIAEALELEGSNHEVYVDERLREGAGAAQSYAGFCGYTTWIIDNKASHYALGNDGFFSVQNITVHIPIGAGGYDLSWIEAVGTIAGLLCIGLASLEKISNYFFGLINVTLFGIIFFQIQLYASLLLQVFSLPRIFMAGMRGRDKPVRTRRS